MPHAAQVSLEKNSVGFYQLAKILVTPTVVGVDFLAYGKRLAPAPALLLLLACVGVWLVTVNDVQFNRYGAAVALAAVYTAAAQKILNSHMQQRCGTTSLQLMRQVRLVARTQSVTPLPAGSTRPLA